MRVILATKSAVDISGICRKQLYEFLTNRGHEVNTYTDIPNKEIFSTYDLGIGFLYRYILKPGFFDAPKFGFVGLHPGIFPAGRGAAPNVWAIINGEPAGATLHWIDEGIDT